MEYLNLFKLSDIKQRKHMFAYILLLLGYFVNKNAKRAKIKINFGSFKSIILYIYLIHFIIFYAYY